jgi:hypothetical protein
MGAWVYDRDPYECALPPRSTCSTCNTCSARKA